MKAIEIQSMFNACVDALAIKLKGGDANPRVLHMRNPNKPQCLTMKQANYLAQCGVRPDMLGVLLGVEAKTPVTPVYRFAQFVYGLQVGDFKNIDMTSARGLCALRLSGGKLNRDALYNLLTGRVKANREAPNTKGVGPINLDRVVKGRTGRGEAETQISRSFGARGFCKVLNMVQSVGVNNAEFTLNEESPLVRRFFALIESATPAQLDEMLGDEE